MRVVIKEMPDTVYLSQTYCHLSTNEKLSEMYGITSYGSGWRKDVVNQSLEVAVTAKSGVAY